MSRGVPAFAVEWKDTQKAGRVSKEKEGRKSRREWRGDRRGASGFEAGEGEGCADNEGWQFHGRGAGGGFQLPSECRSCGVWPACGARAGWWPSRTNCGSCLIASKLRPS